MGKIGFVYTGQGSQYIGMGLDVYENGEWGRQVFLDAIDIMGKDFIDNIFYGSNEELIKTRNTQPALFTVESALTAELYARGIFPVMACGLSLGEYTALMSAGVYDFTTGLSLVSKRGALMEVGCKGKGKMAAVIGADLKSVEMAIETAITDGIVVICNYNSPSQVVIAGEDKALEIVVELLKDEALKIIYLSVEGPFHTPILKDSAMEFGKSLNLIKFQEPKFSVVSNVDGEVVTLVNIKENLMKHMYSPVYFSLCIEKMYEAGVDTIVEIGPGNVLKGFIRKINKNIKVYNVENLEDCNKIAKELSNNTRDCKK